tara:strand:+ start:1917 stop:3368 length:1452 start_codon:yes stop_codon:yes gene_type:complete
MNNEYDEDEMYYSMIDGGEYALSEEVENPLPAVVSSYTDDALLASNFNRTPAIMSFFVVIGQLCKGMVAIPSNLNTDDTRMQFLWLQTSGTGKSTLTNWFLPIVKECFKLVNDKHGTEFDLFDITDYTDAALIGSMEKKNELIQDEDGNTTEIEVDVQIDGQLEGDGLAVWDEFEYSGIFKQSQHKENAVVYLNTFMNTLWGETWVIKKKLKSGAVIECRCQRSSYATSYIPKTLTTVITEKGVLQRMLMFVWEVPQEIQKGMRRRLIADFGKIGMKDEPKLKYSQSFLTIYDTVKERYEEVGEDPYKVMRFTPKANDVLLRECILMEEYIAHSRPEVFSAVETFINRILKHIQKLAILCSIAEAPSIKDKSKRFVVTGKNVEQASYVVRNCYKSLVTWLDEALRVERRAIVENANYGVFKTVYLELSKDDEWVHKAKLIKEVQIKTQRGQQTIYNWWNKVEEKFAAKKINKSVYVKLKGENE